MFANARSTLRRTVRRTTQATRRRTRPYPPGPSAPRARVPVPVPRPPGELPGYLGRLHEGYVYKINLLLEAGREDLARQLADAYADDALSALTADGPTPTPWTGAAARREESR